MITSGCIGHGGEAELGFGLLVLRLHHWLLRARDARVHGGRLLRDLDLASSGSRLNDGVLLSLSVFQIGDLSRRLAASLSNALNRGDYLLVLVTRRMLLAALVDLQFKDPFVTPGASAIRAPPETPSAVDTRLPHALVRHLGLGRLGAIGTSTLHRSLGGVLIADLQLVEAVVQIRAFAALLHRFS